MTEELLATSEEKPLEFEVYVDNGMGTEQKIAGTHKGEERACCGASATSHNQARHKGSLVPETIQALPRLQVMPIFCCILMLGCSAWEVLRSTTSLDSRHHNEETVTCSET
eukprot:6246358-Amphidinium_carterae.1